MVLLPFDDDWRDLGKVNCKKLKSSIFFLIDDLQKMRTFVQIKAKPIPFAIVNAAVMMKKIMILDL